MEEKTKPQTERELETERKLIHLLLNHAPAIRAMFDQSITPDRFDPEHRHLLKAILNYYAKGGSTLPRNVYRDQLVQAKEDVIHRLKVFDLCFIGTDAEPDELQHLIDQTLDNYVGRSGRDYLAAFRKRAELVGWKIATRELQDNLARVNGNAVDWPNPIPLADLPDIARGPIWQGILDEGDIAMLAGYWKHGKTRWTVSFLQALVAGKPFVRPTTKTKVLYVSEEHEARWQKRMKTLNLTLGDGVVLLTKNMLKYQRTLEQWQKLIAYIVLQCQRLGCKVVVIDTLAKFAPYSNENDAANMQDCMDPLDALRDAGITAILIHHLAKSPNGNSLSGRGSGALSGYTDANLGFEQDPGNGATIKFEGKDETGEMWFKWDGKLYQAGACQALSKEERRLFEATDIIKAHAPDPVGIKEILLEWNGKAPNARVLKDTLVRAAESNPYLQIQGGVKGNPLTFAYRNEEQDEWK